MKNILEIHHLPLVLTGDMKPVYCKNGEGKFVSLNMQTKNFFGFDGLIGEKEWILGKSELDFIAIRPDLEEFYNKCLMIEEKAWILGVPCGFLLDVPITDLTNVKSKKIKKSINLIGHQMEVLKFPNFDKDGKRKYILTIIFDLTENSSYDSSFRAVSSNLDKSMETERKSVARDVHDVIGNSVTALKMSLNIIKHHTEKDDVEKALKNIETALKICDETAVEVRRISTGLRPAVLDEYGVAEALEWLINDFSAKNSNIKFTFSNKAKNINVDKLYEATATAMFRIAQESISNAIKHAKCKTIKLLLVVEDNELKMVVKDDGVGAALRKEGGMGLVFMRERAKMVGGNLRIYGGNGTTISFSLNLNSMFDFVHRKKT